MAIQYLSKMARRVDPYVPGEQPKDRRYIKLNTNENPYPPSPLAIAAIKQAAGADLRLYPDPSCTDFVEAVAEIRGVPAENVFVGNASDEVLAMAFMAFFDEEKPVFIADLTYSFYPVYGQLLNVPIKKIPVREDLSIHPADYTRDNGGIVIANPNAPTSVAMPLSKIEQLVKNAKYSVVIVDEAYVDFGGESAVPLVEKYPNLLVVTTLSKSHGLAGLRAGYAIGQPHLIDGLHRIKNSINSYTLDRLAIAGAAAAMRDAEYASQMCAKVMATREWFCEKLTELGFLYAPSSANFVLASHPKRPAAELFAALREKGVLVRYFNMPRIENCLRISIGTDDQMRQVVDILKELL